MTVAGQGLHFVARPDLKHVVCDGAIEKALPPYAEMTYCVICKRTIPSIEAVAVKA